MRKLKLQELKRLSVKDYKEKKKLPLVVVLDNIRSGMNVGSFFRTCDAFLVNEIHLVGITPRPPHKEITKTAIGATQSVDWQYFNKIEESLEVLINAGYTIMCVEQTTDSVDLDEISVSAQEKFAIVFGNEVTGVSNEAINMCSKSIELSQFGTKHSLNVSVCAGIVIHDLAMKIVKKQS